MILEIESRQTRLLRLGLLNTILAQAANPGRKRLTDPVGIHQLGHGHQPHRLRVATRLQRCIGNRFHHPLDVSRDDIHPFDTPAKHDRRPKRFGL